MVLKNDSLKDGGHLCLVRTDTKIEYRTYTEGLLIGMFAESKGQRSTLNLSYVYNFPFFGSKIYTFIGEY